MASHISKLLPWGEVWQEVHVEEEGRAFVRLIFTDDVLHDHRPTLKIQAEGEEYPFSEYLTKLGEVVF